MQNYFNYFTEIEERFQQRRGSLLMLSTLDWALIETWREAGVPLEAVLRGIDDAFDKHDAKALRSPRKSRKVNGLAWCAQSVMEAVEQAVEASIGAAPAAETRFARKWLRRPNASRRYLEQNASLIEAARLSPPADAVAAEIASSSAGSLPWACARNRPSRSKNSTAPSPCSKKRYSPRC